MVYCGGRVTSSLAAVFVFLPLAACSHGLRDLAYRQAGVLELVGSEERAAVLEGVIDRPVMLRRHPLADWRNRRGESPWQTQFELNLTRLKQGRIMQPCSGRVLVTVDGDCSQRSPGDAVRVFGNVRAMMAPTNPGEADRRSAYRQRHLHARVDCESLDQMTWLASRPDLGQRFLSRIAYIASRGRSLLLRHLHESNGPLAVALVLGQREFVDETTRDMLLVTGTAHLLSVSGLHLAIVVAVAGWFATCARMPMTMRIFWIVTVCLFYTALTGARPPVVRAAILVGIVVLALWMRRPAQPINTLSLAALVLMAFNPLLLFNMGVQLSFLAVATLLTCSRGGGEGPSATRQTWDQERRLKRLVDQQRSLIGRLSWSLGRRLGQAVWFSGCVTAISTPLVWQHFHVVSPVSVATNVLLSPFLFVALASGVATIVTGFVYEPAALVPATVCDLAMGGMREIIEAAAAVPGGHHWLPAPPSWWVAGFYLVVVGMTMLTTNRRNSLLRYGWIGIWILLAWWMATRPARLPNGCVEVLFVDVGHGTCVVLRLSDTNVWLYDCGRLGNDSFSSRGMDSVLWSLGVTQLNGVMISHADADHFNALPGVLSRFGVRSIYTPPEMLDQREPTLQTVAEAIRSRDVEVIELARGSRLAVEECEFQILHPPARPLPGSDNANSLVLRIDANKRTIVLPGDLEPPGTEAVIGAERPRPGSILMAPHHGSLRMDAAAMLQWSRPLVTIVSGGRRAGKPEVYEMLAATGSSVHVTSQVGAVRVRIDTAGRIELRSWKESPW